MRARLAALLLLAVAAPLLALDIPPPPKFFYNDAANLLNADQARALNEKLAGFERRSGAQFIIYVFPTLGNEALEDFTIRCAERWKVGNKKYDNGLILFVFLKERKIRIEVGYGLEPTITDAFASRVIREYIAPHFRQSDYVGGLNAAADALIAKIEQKEAPVPPAQPRGGPPASANLSCGPLVGLLFFIVAIIIVASLITRSRPGCGGCLWPLFFMGGGGGRTFGGGGGGGGWSGFSGGGGSFGGGGASGGW